MDEKESQGKVKVVDRRWFNPDGELRDQETTPPAPGPASSPATAPTTDPVRAETSKTMPEDPPAAEPAQRDGDPDSGLLHGTGQPGFVELVDSLAQPAVAFLSGQVPGRGRDTAAARYYIDLLGVLERTTKGNLSFEEKSILDDVLYQLRSLFVAASR